MELPRPPAPSATYAAPRAPFCALSSPPPLHTPESQVLLLRPGCLHLCINHVLLPPPLCSGLYGSWATLPSTVLFLTISPLLPMCKSQFRGPKQRPLGDGGMQWVPNDGITPLNMNCPPAECSLTIFVPQKAAGGELAVDQLADLQVS